MEQHEKDRRMGPQRTVPPGSCTGAAVQEVPLSPQGSGLLPVHPHLFPICHGGYSEARSLQGALPVRPSNPALPSLGR